MNYFPEFTGLKTGVNLSSPIRYIHGQSYLTLRFSSHCPVIDSDSDTKKWKLNIINGTVHTGLSEILSDSYACGKREIFTEDFAKEWVGYADSSANIATGKESLFGIAIAKGSVNGP